MAGPVQRQNADVVVAGGGIAGLWAARRCLAAGASVTVVEARHVGAGASGGVLGALMAHKPDPWTDEKQFQLDALVALPSCIAELESETGLSAGYGRVGRIMPIRDARFRAEAESRAIAARQIWGAVDEGFVLEPRPRSSLDQLPVGWLTESAAPDGLVWDGLAARLEPRAYLTALAASVRAHERGSLLEGVSVEGFVDGVVLLSDGGRISAGDLVIAAGADAFALTERTGCAPIRGQGVKGQAALFDIVPPPGAPMIYDRGVYVLPHASGRIAVGSTTQGEWRGPGDLPDPAMRGYLDRARALCPLLAGAEPVEEWAGLRPRTASRKPVVGRLPGAAPVWIIGGGYKTGIGVAHAMADALAAEMLGLTNAFTPPRSYATSVQCDAMTD